MSIVDVFPLRRLVVMATDPFRRQVAKNIDWLYTLVSPLVGLYDSFFADVAIKREQLTWYLTIKGLELKLNDVLEEFGTFLVSERSIRRMFPLWLDAEGGTLLTLWTEAEPGLKTVLWMEEEIGNDASIIIRVPNDFIAENPTGVKQIRSIVDRHLTAGLKYQITE